MLRPLVVLWLSSTPAQLPPGLTAALNARGYQPVTPALASPAARYDGSVANEVETLLEQARTGTLDPAPAFERIEQLLHAHPELPQAAWLMSERYALEEQQHARAASPEAAAAAALARERARALEGPRSAVASSRAAEYALEAGAVDRGAGVAGVVVTPEVRVANARARDEVIVDGAPLGAVLHPGRHHVQTFRAARHVWSGWADVGQAFVIEVQDPSRACDELDLWGTLAGKERPEPLPGVLCPEWAGARIGASGQPEIAFCQGSSCGAWQALAPRAAAPAMAPSELAVNPGELRSAPAPAWLTWGLVGLAPAGATGLVLWQSGVFDEPARGTEYVFTGPSAASISF